jgi:parvulin-like peptidyl-prolyl isomerase
MPAKSAWKVNGVLISSAEIRTEIAAIRQEAENSGSALSMEERMTLSDTARERLIERAILRTSARQLGFTPTEEQVQSALAQLAPRNDGVIGCRAGMATEENLDDIRQRMAVDQMIASCIAKVRRPQISQVRDFYRKHADRFWTPELAQVRHIVKNVREWGEDEDQALAAVERMRERVLRGDSFEVVAQQDSDCPEHGGDLGYFARGTMVKEFDSVAFSAPIGKLTPPFRTQFGFHAMEVQDRKAEGVRTLDEVQPEIESLLLRQAQDAACGELLVKLRKSARIEQVTE